MSIYTIIVYERAENDVKYYQQCDSITFYLLMSSLVYTHCDDTGLRDRNLTQIRNTKTNVTKYKFIAVKPNQSNC